MRLKLSSLSKNSEFKFILSGKKISNKYLTIFFKKISGKNNKHLNISFITQKKIGNAVKRNKIKRRLKNMVLDIYKNMKLNLNYSYLIIAKKTFLEEEFQVIKKILFSEFKKVK
tara:strand:+ start:195 stop:536 length:342 start_codon:yes stop_codon:yes gene_type:complete